jgi:hypothetical protein
MNDKRKEASIAYMKLLKDTEELTVEQLYLARESFNEGWLQCELTLRAALRNIELRYDTDSDPYEMVEIARAALAGKDTP